MSKKPAKVQKSPPSALRLAVCTGGGDCPGLNAAIHAVTRAAILGHGYEVIGIREGLTGLIREPNEVIPLSLETVEGIFERGGTILGTSNKGSPFRGTDGGKDFLTRITASWRAQALDALIVIGGDGTQGMAKHLSRSGLPVVGIPKTIDNDVVGSDQTIGYATAIETATDAALRLRSSAAAHDRMMVLELMGRDAGHIALAAAVAASADVALIPEIPFQLKAVTSALVAKQRRAKNHAALIIVAEGATVKGGKQLFKISKTGAAGGKLLGGIAAHVAEALHAESGVDARVTVLGHVQRGGPGNVQDRLLAAALGTHAVELAAARRFGRVIVTKNGSLAEIPYAKLSDGRRNVDLKGDLIRTAEALGICLGR